jgi:hypothetical protein
LSTVVHSGLVQILGMMTNVVCRPVYGCLQWSTAVSMLIRPCCNGLHLPVDLCLQWASLCIGYDDQCCVQTSLRLSAVVYSRFNANPTMSAKASAVASGTGLVLCLTNLSFHAMNTRRSRTINSIVLWQTN